MPKLIPVTDTAIPAGRLAAGMTISHWGDTAGIPDTAAYTGEVVAPPVRDGENVTVELDTGIAVVVPWYAAVRATGGAR